MRNIFEHLKVAAQTLLPLVATVVTLAPLAGWAHAGTSIVVLGAAVCLTSARTHHGRRVTPRRLIMVPLTMLGVSAVALVFATSLAAGDALFVIVVFVSTAARAVGPRAAAIGRAAMLPLLSLFIAPVHVGSHPARTVVWATVAVLTAGVWTLLGAALIRTGETGTTERSEEPANRRVHVWRGTRSAISMAAAFLLGQVLFPDHWTWTVIAAFTIGVAARSRGDVVLKGAQRMAGALVGTVGATLLSDVVAGRPRLAVVLILVFLAAGLFLREYNYLFWAMSITSVLALLYGLNGQSGGAGLLRERLLAGLLGAACAIVPAVFLAPIQTRALVLKRAGTALRSIRAALETHQAADVQRAEHDINAVREAAGPLLAIRRIHRRQEVDWVEALTGALPDLRGLLSAEAGPAAARLGRTTKELSGSVRAAAAEYRVAMGRAETDRPEAGLTGAGAAP